jgi:hypothetical protein
MVNPSESIWQVEMPYRQIDRETNISIQAELITYLLLPCPIPDAQTQI